MTADTDVYQFLLAPEYSRLSKVKARLANYAQVTEYAYNSYGDVTKEVDPKGNSTTTQYLPATTTHLRLPTEVKKTAAGNPNHFHKETYAYNADKLLSKETIVDSYPDGTGTKVDQVERTYTYQNKQVSSVTETSSGADAKSLTQTIDWYDDLGLYPAAISMEVETAPGVQSTLSHYFSYDGLGRLLTRVYPDYSYVQYQYDLLGRRISEQFTNQDETRTLSYAYDDPSRKVTTILPDGTKRFTHFTPYGEVEYQGQVGTDGSIRPLLYNTYSLDGNHLLSSAPYALNERATTYVYNEDGSVWQEKNPIGTTVYLAANAVSDGTRYVPAATTLTLAPNGLATTQYYDRQGQLEKEISRTGDGTQSRTTQYERNDFDQVIRKTEWDQTGKERTWDYRYTTNGNLVYLVDPEQNTYKYAYDALGNLASVTENKTLTTQNHYNALSWKISEQDVPSGAMETYSYFASGKTATFTDKAGNKHEYAYTPFYDLASLTTKNVAGAVTNKETKEYVPNTSLIKKETNSNGANPNPTSSTYREVSYTYDPFQRMNSLTAFGRVYLIGYNDRDDQMDQLTYPDHTSVAYSYDAAERLQQVNSTLTGTIRYDYHTDSTGERYHVAYPNGWGMDRKRDSFGHVTNLTHTKNAAPVWTESSQFSFGNVVAIQRNGASYKYEYDKVDRLTKETVPDATNQYSYDGRGNRSAFEGQMPTEDGTTTYTFDERNRLRSVANEETGDTASYTYYGDGLRATKVENGTETKYVYLNGKVIEELDGASNVLARNVWGNELLYRKDVASNKSGYYRYNSHGDVVSIADGNGSDLNTYDYDSWGNLVSRTEGISNPFTYSGEIYDDETGFYYLRARYYDPKVGRFISEDTYKGQVENPLSLNRYTYGWNNPSRYKDPSGHNPDPLEEAWFGQKVHKEVQTLFRATFGKFADTEVRLPSLKRMDMVLTLGKMKQVYELKPISNSPRGSKDFNQKAKAQLDGYVNELNQIAQKTKSGILTVKGTAWNPNGLTLPHPTDPKKELVLYTYYDTDPGMIYYGERYTKKGLEMEMQESVQKEMDRFEHNLNIIRIFMPGRSPLGIPIPVP